MIGTADAGGPLEGVNLTRGNRMNLIVSMVLLAAAALPAACADITGTWKAVFKGELGSRPKMVSEIVLELYTRDGGAISGIAHMGAWPGDAALMDGKVEGGRISFTACGSTPWRSKSASGNSSGLPKLSFTGTLHENEIRLVVVWDNVMLYGEKPAAAEHLMTAERISK